MDALHLTPLPDLQIREFVPEDEQGVQALFTAAEDYFVAATGDPAAPGDVQSLFYALPAGAEPGAKRLLVVVRDGQVIGLVDAVLGHPQADAAAVGLFLVHPDHRRQGLGDTISTALLEQARGSGIRLVTATTPIEWAAGSAFLESLGFAIAAPDDARPQPGNRNVGPRESTVLRGALHLHA